MTGSRRGSRSVDGSIMWFLLSCLLLLSASLQTTTVSAQTLEELITTYDGGWIQDGVMFDVQTVTVDSTDAANTVAAPDGITIYGLNVLTPLTTAFCVELYTKSGSYSTDANNPAAWTFLGSFSLTGEGPNSPTPIPLGSFDPVVVGAGETQAFYVTTQDEKLRYTSLDGQMNSGDVYASSEVYYGTSLATERGIEPGGGDEHSKSRKQRTLQNGAGDGLKVDILVGVAKNYPFQESWQHRVFNGALLYAIGTDPALSFLSDEQIQEAWDAKRGYVTCDADAIPVESYPSVAPSLPRLPTSSPTAPPVSTRADILIIFCELMS